MSDVALTRVKIEQCNDEIKAENIPGEDGYGIKQEKQDAASLLHGTFESLESEWQKEAQCKIGNSDSAHKCEVCGKTFSTNRYLALHMKIHSEQPDKSFEESNYKLIKDVNASEAIEIKREFSEVDTEINFGDIYNGITDEKSKIIDFDLIRVKKEQSDDEIKSENKSDDSQDSIEEELQVAKTEFVNCEKPSGSKRAQTKSASNSAHKCEICNKSFATNKYLVYHKKLHTAQLVKCEICNKDVKSINLRQHIKAHAVASQLKGSSPSHKCETCNKSFARRNYLVAHMKIHTGFNMDKCNVCGKEYTTSYMPRHVRTHTGEKPFVCHICGKEYTKKENLKAHISSHLGAERKYKCDFCGKAFLRRGTLNGHVALLHSKSNSVYKCEICDKEFPTRKYLHRHKKRHTAALEKCNICGKEYINLLRHLKTHTNSPKVNSSNLSYKCVTCNKSFAQKKYLDDHTKIHTGKNLYKCTICGKEYTRSYLRRHMVLHTGEKQFECDICGQKFVYKQSLVNHTNMHLGENNQYKCDICNKIYTRKYRLANHKATHSESNASHKCEICNKSFLLKSRLASHIKIHTQTRKLRKCHVCNKEVSSRNLRQHMRTHTGEKRFICDVCGQTFRHKISLVGHMSLHSGGDKQYKCNICEKKFSRRALMRHKILHSPHECEICHKKFSQQQYLSAHVKLHTGEKSDICHETFSLQQNLSAHVKLHTGEKTHKCDICGKNFSRKDVLQHHIRRHLRDNAYKCDVCGVKFVYESNLTKHKKTRHGSNT